MQIPVVGFDPSLRHWGIAQGELDLTTGYLHTPVLSVVEPDELVGKQVRVNSNDLFCADQLAQAVFAAAKGAKAIFAEVPVGSQSARGMCSYGVCVGILGALRAQGYQVIEVTADEVKRSLSGTKNATKQQMIDAALGLYPEAKFPVYAQNGKGYKKGEVTSKAEHVADALGAIHAGVNTPLFQSLMRLYET